MRGERIVVDGAPVSWAEERTRVPVVMLHGIPTSPGAVASRVVRLVERRNRFLRLVHLPEGRGADELRDALAIAVADLPACARLSLTWDQGSEMTRQDQLRRRFFSYPGRPWERASNPLLS